MEFDHRTWRARAVTITVLGGLVLSGCGSVTAAPPGGSSVSPPDATAGTAPTDGSSVSPPDATAGSAPPVCFGKVFPICYAASAVPSAPRTLQGLTSIDTDSTGSTSECDQDNDQQANYCVVAGAGFTLPAGATLTAHGSKPLVLLSTTTMEIAGSIDVSSSPGGAQPLGPGANPKAACMSTPPPIGPTQNGGGYGGSFGTQGGNGGTSQLGTGGGVAATKLAAFPTVLRGGCSGSYGSAGGTEVQGGDGGGAVALIAAMQVHVDGTINASGAGGRGGIQNVGDGGGAGSGGGSGGMILLDSPLPLVFGANVMLWANGGSGGQGAAAHTDGASGTDSSAPSTGATTAVTSGAAGSGAAGSVGTTPGGKGGSVSSGGGGGGGGGGGFTYAPGLTDPASISPPSS